MSLKPEVSLGVALATGAVVFATYEHALPSVADVRVAKPQDADINAARKMASWTSAGLVAGISLISKDPTVFVVGGAMVVALDWWYRHADAVNPLVQKATNGAKLGSPAPVQDASVASSDVYDYAS